MYQAFPNCYTKTLRPVPGPCPFCTSKCFIHRRILFQILFFSTYMGVFLAQRIHGTLVYLPNMYHKNQLHVDKSSSLMDPLGCLKNNLHMLPIGNSDPWKNAFSGGFWCMRKTQRNHLTTYELFQNGFIFPNFFWKGDENRVYLKPLWQTSCWRTTMTIITLVYIPYPPTFHVFIFITVLKEFPWVGSVEYHPSVDLRYIYVKIYGIFADYLPTWVGCFFPKKKDFRWFYRY